MAIIFNYSGPRAFLMLHGYVDSLRFANRREGLTIAITNKNVTGKMERAPDGNNFIIFSVHVDKIMTVEGPADLMLFVRKSGGFKANEWYDLAREHIPEPATLALFKVTEVHKWAKGAAERENSIRIFEEGKFR
jgi:hypothetical protein